MHTDTALHENLRNLQNAWSLKELEAITEQYQHDLCDEYVHLDRIEPRSRYEISAINVPVFAYKQMPALCFSAGSFKGPMTGEEIETIASRMQSAAERVTARARARGVGAEDPEER